MQYASGGSNTRRPHRASQGARRSDAVGHGQLTDHAYEVPYATYSEAET